MARALAFPSLTPLPFAFPGTVYRSPMPHSRQYDREGAVFPEALRAGVSAVVPLASREDCIDETDGRDLYEIYAKHHLVVLPFAVADYGAPPLEALEAYEALVANVEGLAMESRSVLVHCSAGIGRTGTFLACLAVRTLRLDGPGAVAWVRETIAGAVEKPVQHAFIAAFAARSRGR